MIGWESGWVAAAIIFVSVEREKGFEPSTSTLARWRQSVRRLGNRLASRWARDVRRTRKARCGLPRGGKLGGNWSDWSCP
jgi:hypothetical protein